MEEANTSSHRWLFCYSPDGAGRAWVSSLLAEEDAAPSSRGGVPAEALLRSAGDVSPEDRRVLDEFLGMCRDYAELRRKHAGGTDHGR